MTSYLPQTRYRQKPQRWFGAFRFETRAEAEAHLAEIRAELADLLETRILDSPYGPTEGYRKNRRKNHP